MSLLNWRTSGTDSKAVRNLDCTHEECTHTCQLLKQGGGSSLKFHGTVTSFLWLPQSTPQPKVSGCTSSFCCLALLNTRVRSAVAEERAHLWKTEQAQTQHSNLTEQGQPLLAFTGAADQEQSGTLVCQDHNSMPLAYTGCPLKPLLLQYCSSLQWRCQCWECRKQTLKRNRTSSDVNLRASAPTTWEPFHPW